MTQQIYFVVDDKLHRGFRDQSGRFTLEQCNLAKANEADNLEEFQVGSEDLPAGLLDRDHCLHCFPQRGIDGE